MSDEDTQSETLAMFQSLTGEEDTARSLAILRAYNWNLNDAVNAAMDPSSSPSSFQRGPPHSYPTPLPPNNPQPPLARGPVVNVRHPHNIAAQRRPVPLLFWPFTLLYRLIARPLSFGTSLITGILRFGFNFLGSLLPFYNARREDPATATTRFLTQFENTYGNEHPQFLTGTYNQAVERARTECKFLFVYLHCELNQNTPQFCRNTLCAESVSTFVNDNFVSWAANIRTSQGYQVNNVLGATTYPFMAVVCCNPIPGFTTGSSATIIDRIEDMIAPEELIVRLATLLQNFGSYLTNSRVEREQRETDRMIRQEQDEAYLKSLAEDEEKERKARAEEERILQEQRQAEEEERRMVEAEEALRRALEAKRTSLPVEPREDDKDSVRLTVRLPDGTRLSRRFKSNDKMQTVLDYLDVTCNQPISDNYHLVSNFPKQTYTRTEQTLKEAQLYPHPVALFVQEK